ncbi:hypothetical protein KY320_02515, partial [Candidatus Woesearchaeota archaeon]|nr:hypothetical protein [Candidatus Woesearchaeota archaeon]
MNKKAMVFSVMVILALVVCFVILQSLAKIESQNKDFRVNRAQLLVFDHFVRDFDSYFIEEILRSAAKPALAELSQSAPFTKKDVVDLMEDGIFGSHAIDSASTTEASLNNALNTLSF